MQVLKISKVPGHQAHLPQLQLQLDEHHRGKHVQPQEGRLHLDQPRPEELRVVRQPALPAGGRAAAAQRGGARQVPRDAHVRHVCPPAHRHEGRRPPAGPRPDAREGEEGPCDRAKGSHKRRPTKLDKSLDQGLSEFEHSFPFQCF